MARNKRRLPFRLLTGLTHWLNRLLQRWSQDAAGGEEEPEPEFGWDAPEDWLRRATPQPPADWAERVRTVLPDWEPSRIELAIPLPEGQAESGNRRLPEERPAADRESRAPIQLPHGSRRFGKPERPQPGKVVPLSPRATPLPSLALDVEPQRTEARSPEPTPALRRTARHLVKELVPQRIPLAPAEPPEPDAVVTRKREPAEAPAPEVRKRPSDRPVQAETQPDRLTLRQAIGDEAAADQVTFARRTWPEVEPAAMRPRQLPEADSIAHRPLPSMTEEVLSAVTYTGRAPLSDQEPVWIEEDRWPVLPEGVAERVEQEVDPRDDLARRTRLDREQEGQDAWSA